MNEKIGVIGGGQMGSQIASLSAMAGYETHIYDQDIENLTSKLKFAEDNLKNLISKKIESPVPLETTIKTCELINAIYRSDEDKKWIKVKKEISSKRLGK